MSHHDDATLKMRPLMDYIRVGEDVINSIGVTLVDNSSDDFFGKRDFTQKKNVLMKEMQELNALKIQLKDNVLASQQTNDEILRHFNTKEDNESSQNELKDVEDIFAEKLSAIQSENNIEQNENWKKLVNVFNDYEESFNKSDDDELKEIESDVQIPIDPFTKLPITHPVKNRKCGHVYDKNGLQQVLGTRPGGRLRCPTIGCNNRDVKMDDVVDDQRTKILIERIRRQQEN